MRRRRRQPGVPTELAERVDDALATVETARTALAEARSTGAPMLVQRAAHHDLRRAFDAADALLREATHIAQQSSYGDWAAWRRRLSTLDARRQVHLFAEMDAAGMLPVCSVRAIDTGMSGPDIGEMQHGESCAPGTPATYGFDFGDLLDRLAGSELAAGPEEMGGGQESTRPRADTTVVPLPPAPVDRPPEAA